MKDAKLKLKDATTNAEKKSLFKTKAERTILKLLKQQKPNYAYIFYEVKNNIFNTGYKSKKVKDKLIAHSKIHDFASPLSGIFTVTKPPQDRKYDNGFEVGSPRNINKGYPIEFGLGKAGGTWLRHTDTEAMLLEELRKRFNKDTEADVHLFTYLEPCLSCDLTIAKFLEDFKKVNLNIYFYKLKENSTVKR